MSDDLTPDEESVGLQEFATEFLAPHLDDVINRCVRKNVPLNSEAFANLVLTKQMRATLDKLSQHSTHELYHYVIALDVEKDMEELSEDELRSKYRCRCLSTVCTDRVTIYVMGLEEDYDGDSVTIPSAEDLSLQFSM